MSSVHHAQAAALSSRHAAARRMRHRAPPSAPPTRLLRRRRPPDVGRPVMGVDLRRARTVAGHWGTWAPHAMRQRNPWAASPRSARWCLAAAAARRSRCMHGHLLRCCRVSWCWAADAVQRRRCTDSRKSLIPRSALRGRALNQNWCQDPEELLHVLLHHKHEPLSTRVTRYCCPGRLQALRTPRTRVPREQERPHALRVQRPWTLCCRGS